MHISARLKCERGPKRPRHLELDELIQVKKHFIITFYVFAISVQSFLTLGDFIGQPSRHRFRFAAHDTSNLMSFNSTEPSQTLCTEQWDIALDSPGRKKKATDRRF